MISREKINTMLDDADLALRCAINEHGCVKSPGALRAAIEILKKAQNELEIHLNVEAREFHNTEAMQQQCTN